MLRLKLLTVAGWGLLFMSGCGEASRPKPVAASGTVMLKSGKPTPGALVVLHPTDPAYEKTIGGKPVGKVGEDGKFTLTTYEEGDGAPPGEYGVTVDWRGNAKEKKMSLGDGGASGPPLLKPMYSNPSQPFMKVTIKPGDPNTLSITVE